MSLKITNTGFKIGGINNPSITEIYVRALCDMTKQNPLKDQDGNITHIEIKTNAKVTINGGLFDDSIQVDYIYKEYWLKYSVLVTDMNSQYLEIEEDLKARLITDNPEWSDSIEIVTLGV